MPKPPQPPPLAQTQRPIPKLPVIVSQPQPISQNIPKPQPISQNIPQPPQKAQFPFPTQPPKAPTPISPQVVENEVKTILPQSIPVKAYQMPIKKSPLSPSSGNPISMTPIQLSPVHTEKSPIQFLPFSDNTTSYGGIKSMKPISFRNNSHTSEPSIDQTYTSVSALWNEIQHMQPNDPRISQSIADFDDLCNSFIAKFGPIQPEKVHPMLPAIKFPFTDEKSLDLSSLDLSYDFSATDLIRTDSFGRAPSLTSQIFSAKDNFASQNIWNNRPFTDENVMHFENTALNNEFAAIIMVPFGSTQKGLSVNKYHEKNSQWLLYNIELKNKVESMALGSLSAWLLTSNSVANVPFSKTMDTKMAPMPETPGVRCITSFNNGSVVHFSNSSDLIFLDNEMHQTITPTKYKGITAIAPTNDKLMCCITGSCALRMISATGDEIRTFAGHCAPVTGVVHMGNEVFASFSSDSTVRIWDSRQFLPVTTISAPDSSVCCLSGTPEYVICGFHNKKIGVVDLRKPSGKAILGVNTQDYEPINMCYDQNYDTLAMFGITQRGTNDDSMRFFDIDGSKSQRVFRTYQSFIGINSK
ncbi:hypothetical protein GPJ56_007800 [Histomonas meleagridis]|uniref:uncharacterized protein n=1 Tax=Histomonas meleagridis TaxID=135588 RepID=UPI0035598092|nr:hypothetical protein GPJ56_007800 [Histomonas meleagridis]KAH0798721.1 hypothetical protein GO595_008586 [Histomonas meleagridis]